jgi:AraC-like DNA-binding protein
MATMTPLRRTEFSTSHPGEAREFIDRAFGGTLTMSANRDSAWRASLTQVTAGDLTVGDLTLPADLTFKTDGRAYFTVTILVDGTVAHDRGDSAARYCPGDVYLGTYPRASFVARTHNARVHAVTITGALLAEALLTDVAGRFPGALHADVEFVAQRPSALGARQWHQAAKFVDGILGDPQAAAAPLVIGSAARLLAATALSIFPNTAVTEPAAAERRDALPAVVRKAVDFIEANADGDITLSDIAAAAHVTPRTLQLAFHRHLDASPMAVLRRVRLDRAHRQLRAADPASQTVAAVAYQWGFSSASRFAHYYRAAYGARPSHTLRG